MIGRDPNDESMILSRRSMLLGGAALGGACFTGMDSAPLMASSDGAAPRLPREGQVPTDPAGRNAMIRRIRLRADSGYLFWYYRGMTYAQQGLDLIPLSELIFGLFQKVTPLPDGGLQVQSFELAFRTRPGSADRAEQIYNPITDQWIDVPYAPIGPSTSLYDENNHLQIQPRLGGSELELRHQPELFYHLDDEICFQRHSQARVKTAGKPDRVLNEMSMMASPANEALDISRPFANARAYAGDVSDFARWLNMPEGAGYQTLRSVGKKYAAFAHMPREFRSMLADVDGALAADPLSAFDRDLSQYQN